jgi:threonine aldolase
MLLNLAGDDDGADVAELARRLAAAADAAPAGAADVYSLGGAVAAFERRIAAVLGKESAVLMPTGTLANLLAARAHASRTRGRRVVVQAESHAANDAGDCLAELAGLTLRPIPHAGFTAAAVAAEIDLAATARVAAPVAAVIVESPVRRLAGATVPFAEQGAICAAARARGVACHLDGARLFIAAGFLGRSVAALAAPYDSVYVSLYKYFGAPFGAILAGPAALTDGLFHERRRFGGSLAQAWPAALLADRALDDLEPTWRAVAARARAVVAALTAAGVAVDRPDDGTNVYRLTTPPGVAASVPARAAAADVRPPAAAGDRFEIKANASWLASPEADVTERLLAVFAPGR